MVAIAVGFGLILLSSFVAADESPESRRPRGVVESCTGCSLRKFPDVKAFIDLDISDFEGVIFKHVPGAPPDLVLYDERDQEVERISLNHLSRKECSDLLLQKGFKRISKPAASDSHTHEDI